MLAHSRLVMLLMSWGLGWLVAAQEPPPLSLGWQQASSVQVRGGYKDNPLLSGFEPEGGAFVGVALDAFAWRPLSEQAEVEGFFLGEFRQYFAVEGLDREQTLFGLVQARHDVVDTWRLSGALEYAYQDQVLDVSATEAEVLRARVQGHGFAVYPAVRHAVGGGWLELRLRAGRQLFEGLLDDYWELGPRLSWEWPVVERTELGLSYELTRNWYDTDEEREATGEAIPGTQRRMTRHEAVLTARRDLDAARYWRMTLRVSGRVNRDDGSGYYDYVRPQAAMGLRYRQGGWELEVGGRVSHYAYRVQIAEPEDGTRRRRLEVQADARVERRLTRSLSVFLEYQYERTFANRGAEEYSVNTVSGGLEWAF